VVPAFRILLQSIELDGCIEKMAQLGAIRLFSKDENRGAYSLDGAPRARLFSL
jgi:hypothetical protein